MDLVIHWNDDLECSESTKLDHLQPTFSTSLAIGRQRRKTMEARQFSDARTAFILKRGADGMPMADICRKAGISQASYFNGKKAYDGLLPTEMRRVNPHRFPALAAGAEKLEARRGYDDGRPRGAIGDKPPIPLQNPGGAPARCRDQGPETPASGGPKNGLGSPGPIAPGVLVIAPRLDHWWCRFHRFSHLSPSGRCGG